MKAAHTCPVCRGLHDTGIGDDADELLIKMDDARADHRRYLRWLVVWVVGAIALLGALLGAIVTDAPGLWLFIVLATLDGIGLVAWLSMNQADPSTLTRMRDAERRYRQALTLAAAPNVAVPVPESPAVSTKKILDGAIVYRDPRLSYRDRPRRER